MYKKAHQIKLCDADGLVLSPDLQVHLSEECDDFNTRDYDGCSSTCIVEDGFTCSEGSDGISICSPDPSLWETEGEGNWRAVI